MEIKLICVCSRGSGCSLEVFFGFFRVFMPHVRFCACSARVQRVFSACFCYGYIFSRAPHEEESSFGFQTNVQSVNRMFGTHRLRAVPERFQDTGGLVHFSPESVAECNRTVHAVGNPDFYEDARNLNDGCSLLAHA